LASQNPKDPIDLREAQPKVLAGIISLVGRRFDEFAADELGAAWRHQLNSSLTRGFEDSPQRASLHELTTGHDGEFQTFTDLLRHPHPPLQLLKILKEFAKSQNTDNDSALPAPMGKAMYYAAIAAARVRCQTRISTLTDEQLAQGYRWALAEPWLDEPTRELLTAALALA
jgi:hypothetical protein